jgi:hypothetical protein
LPSANNRTHDVTGVVVTLKEYTKAARRTDAGRLFAPQKAVKNCLLILKSRKTVIAFYMESVLIKTE